GAVGAFVGEVGADIGGAFVAHPTAALDPNTINFADWAGAAGNPKTTVMNKDNTGTEPLVNGVANVTSAFANFVQGLEIVDDFGFNFAGTPHATATDVDGTFLLLEADSPSGVAYSSVHESSFGGLTYYAGLLPGTTLGAPLPDSFPTTIWDAKLGGIRRSGDQILLYSNPSFKMRVIFNGSTGTINSGTLSNQSFTPGTISVPFTVNGRSHVNNNHVFNIEGKFGSDGLLYGKVTNFNLFGGVEATLTGLIGVNGAVGAFVQGNFGGGFVAKPPE
ncbi:MAG: hypothetical protein K8953_02720, partial [Proteobacteria bacterium]|nr:hypothetical protein [Pseudomonadota bacterium]